MKRRRSRKGLALILVPSAIAAAVLTLSTQEAEPLPSVKPQPAAAQQVSVEQPAEFLPAIAPSADVPLESNTVPLPDANDALREANADAPAQADSIAELEWPSPDTMLAAASSEPTDAHTQWSGTRSVRGGFTPGFAIGGGRSGGGVTDGSSSAPPEEVPTTPPAGDTPSAGIDDSASGKCSTNGALQDKAAPPCSPPAAGLPPEDGVPGNADPSVPSTPTAGPTNPPEKEVPPETGEPWPPIENGESHPVSVPEPSALGLFGIALLGMAFGRRRTKRC